MKSKLIEYDDEVSTLHPPTPISGEAPKLPPYEPKFAWTSPEWKVLKEILPVIETLVY